MEYINKICNGIKIMAIRVEDRAYFPPESGYKTDGSWYWTTRAGSKPFMAYTPPEEPQYEQQGYEGCVKYDQTAALRALVLNYSYTKDNNSLELANRLIRFMSKPGMWKDTTAEGFPGNEKGIWEGHFHATMIALHGLTEFAVARDDETIKQFVRQAYDNAIRNTVIAMGWSPFWIPPGGFNRPKYLSGWCDTCNVADTIVEAVKLTDAGLGDYWDDVDRLVRNQLAEQQICDLDKMRDVCGSGNKNDELLKKYLGGFGGLEATRAKPLTYGCCSANGPMGLYYAWHGITRFDKGVATVNMFLNRASDWMDVYSYLPYEGKVVLLNKKAHTALVRIPAWIDIKKISCLINQKNVIPTRSENYLVFSNLKAKDKIELQFPVQEYREKHVIYGTEFTLTLRGSTVIDITPREYPPISQVVENYKKMYPVYQRNSFNAAKSPMKKARMFVADKLIDLQ